MKCWHCDNEAKAVCVFCGRGICAKHRKGKRHFAGYGMKNKQLLTAGFFDASRTATCVNDASWCGLCHVEEAETY